MADGIQTSRGQTQPTELQYTESESGLLPLSDFHFHFLNSTQRGKQKARLSYPY